MKKFCDSLADHGMEIIKFKRKKWSYWQKNSSKLCKGKLEDKHAKDKIYCTFWDHYHFTGEYRCTAHNTWNLKYIVHLKKLL